MAQPTKLTESVQRTLVQAIGLGAPISHACKAAGISYDSYDEWRQKAAQGRAPYRQLFQEIEKAEGQRVSRWLAQIEKAATEGSWQASAWKLERTLPDHFALRQRMELDVNIAWEEIETSELERLAAGPTRPGAYKSPRPPRITEAKAS